MLRRIEFNKYTLFPYAAKTEVYRDDSRQYSSKVRCLKQNDMFWGGQFEFAF